MPRPARTPDAGRSQVPAPTAFDADGDVRADVAVVGAGVAGLYAAVRLPAGLDVVVVDKGTPGSSGSSPWAQGGLAAALGPGDSPALHADDTCRAGDGLCDPAAVRVLTTEAPTHIAELLARGAAFDRVDDTEDRADLTGLHLAREGGQSQARSVHRADATGAEMIRVLRLAAAPRVSRLAGTAAAVAREPGGAQPRVSGVWVWTDTRGLVLVRARAVLLATGGCGGLFAATTNQDNATADGIALGVTAGAAARDLEFVQFHPTGLAVDGSWRFLLTESLRGAGATLHDATGHRFLPDRHPDAELAPRHVVAKAILDQDGGRAWLDATGVGDERLTLEFPTVLEGVRRYGFDLARERVPVTPAAHYMVGGLRTDLDARTSLPGLYAAGEVASTGVHGANRMASNSLTEALVFGARAAASMAAELPARTPPTGPAPSLAPTPALPDPGAWRGRLRTAMLEGAGPVRSAGGLAELDRILDELAGELGPPAADATHLELSHALTAARLIAAAAALRPESRGGHWRSDRPRADAAWAHVHLEQIVVSG